ncbi:MAG: COX15/CtaA family protein [Acidobacteriia bacterium]|nr:COX15/CtaA family protein [Terriglobia bacterium]
MSSAYHPGLHRFSLVLLACTFLLLIAGALVTSNDAALAVPDWPLSYGTLTPPMVGGIFYEHSHRVIAAGIGFLTIILAVWTWLAESRRWVRWLALAALGAVILQGVLGGLTVLLNLHYGMPIAHACLAQIFFGAVMGMALFTSRWWISDQPSVPDSGSPSIHSFALFNAATVFLQVILGAGFRHKSIPIWPHILGAFLVAATVTWTALTLRHRFGNVREMKLARILINSVFGVQFLLGIAAWASRLVTADAPQPMPAMVALTVIHTVTGALTFACSLLVVMLCYRLVPRSSEAAMVSTRTEAAIS